VPVEEASRAITTYDIRWACDVLRPAYDTTGGMDGRVSIEVDPRAAKDTHKTIAEARNLWWMVDRPNLFIKIPATPEGLPAITQAISEGISVNVTLIFSLQRYGEVIDAYLAGLEQAKAAGRDLSQIRSMASFFVSRVDAEVDARLDKLGTAEASALRGKAAIANARLAYELFERRFAGERWQALRASGAQIQRPLWASTSTKDPAFPDTMYVTELVVSDTVKSRNGMISSISEPRSGTWTSWNTSQGPAKSITVAPSEIATATGIVPLAGGVSFPPPPTAAAFA
jgi:transaldolase